MEQDFRQSAYDYAQDEMSLLDIGVILARKRRVIARTTALFAILGLVTALAAPSEYRASMTVMSELGGDASVGGGLGSTLRSFGFSLPGGGSGGTLSAQAIPSIVSSRQVRLAVARDSFYFPEIGREATLVAYLSRDRDLRLGEVLEFVKSWTLGLPGKILSPFRSTRNRVSPSPGGESLFLTEEEEAAIEWVGASVSASENITSGLITIAASGEDPIVASQLVATVAEKLRLRVQEVYTYKTRQNLEFVENQFEQARSELQRVDAALAEFRDRNQALTSSRVQLEEQRLQREVTFKSQLYTELQAQLTQARIELQKSEPVITTIEAPSPPRGPSGPNRKLTLLLALMFGGMAGIGLAFVSSALESGGKEPEDRAKLAEIRAALPGLPRWLRRG